MYIYNYYIFLIIVCWGQIDFGVISTMWYFFYFGANIQESIYRRFAYDTDLNRGDQMLLCKSNRKLVGLPTLAPELKRKGISFVRKKKMGKISVKDRPPVLTKCCKNIHYFFCQGMYLVSSKFSFLAIGQKLYF